MSNEQTRALVSVALLAAYADGMGDARERQRIDALITRLDTEGLDASGLNEAAARGQLDVATVAATLAKDRALAERAYETAVAVVDADGTHTPAEGAFLERLAAALGISAERASQTVAKADAIAQAAVPSDSPRAVQGQLQADPAELDKRILDASITNAALELLPETLASMAILPLQMRLVYRIGQAHGYELDAGHIKEFIATLGIGLTGQYLEQFGRRLLGGALGGMFGGLGRQAASSGMAFAATWAIGQLARRYYAGGRTLEAAKLKGAFTSLASEGQQLVARYAPAIEERARSIDLRDLARLVTRS